MTNVAAEYLRRMAPAQSHSNRREFFKTAEMLEGPDIARGMVIYDIPIRDNGYINCYAVVTFDRSLLTGKPEVTLRVEKINND